MKMKNVVTGLVLASGLAFGSAAFAGDKNQADWSQTLNIKLALLNKLGTDSTKIDVDSTAGAVRLSGVVSKRETKELADTVAKSVAGVKTVDNDLELAATVNNPSQASAAVGEAEAELKDAVLETKIRIALVDKMGGDGFDVGTDAASGVVTLEFDKDVVGDRRQQAATIVKSVEGVKKVVTVDKKS